jgi:hypothetical protein
MVGEVRGVVFDATTRRRVALGDVLPGRYDVKFPGTKQGPALQIDVAEGQLVQVNCDPNWGVCAVASVSTTK